MLIILPREIEEFSAYEAYVIRVLSKHVYLQIYTGTILDTRKKVLWVITNSKFTSINIDQFMIGFDPPEDYTQPPPRLGVREIYYRRNGKGIIQTGQS